MGSESTFQFLKYSTRFELKPAPISFTMQLFIMKVPSMFSAVTAPMRKRSQDWIQLPDPGRTSVHQAEFFFIVFYFLFLKIDYCQLCKVNARRGHAVIYDGENFLVVGGFGNFKNEVCTLSGNMTCVEQSETLDYYAYYPELFLVTEDFGKDITKC